MRGGRTKVSQYVSAGNKANWLSGGTETYVQDSGVLYKVMTFTATGTLSVTAMGAANVEYLVVAGGGGGGYNSGGGGGAGGYCTGLQSLIAGTSYTVTVGAGGATTNSPSVRGGNGSDSVFSSVTSRSEERRVGKECE